MRFRHILSVLLAVLTLFVATPRATAQAGPPLGGWAGGTIRMYLDGNGGYTYQEPGANLVGQWEWMETGQAGGVLVLHYTTPTVTQTFDNVIRFGIIWQDRNSIILSDPVGGGQFPLRRQF